MPDKPKKKRTSLFTYPELLERAEAKVDPKAEGRKTRSEVMNEALKRGMDALDGNDVPAWERHDCADPTGFLLERARSRILQALTHREGRRIGGVHIADVRKYLGECQLGFKAALRELHAQELIKFHGSDDYARMSEVDKQFLLELDGRKVLFVEMV